MTTIEADLILVESLGHSRNSRVEFYKIKAKEMGYSWPVFYKDLIDSLNRLKKTVNTVETWGWDENGKFLPVYKTIHLSSFTNGKMNGVIDSDSVKELQNSFYSAAIDDAFEYVVNNIDNLVDESQIENLPSPLQTNLKTEQRAKLFTELVEGKFISSDTDPDCFNWAIGATDETEPKQPGQWQPIEWKKALQLLRELLEAIKKSDKISKAEMERITPTLFSSKGKSIELPNNKITETQFHKRLTKILATVLNN